MGGLVGTSSGSFAEALAGTGGLNWRMDLNFAVSVNSWTEQVVLASGCSRLLSSISQE